MTASKEAIEAALEARQDYYSRYGANGNEKGALIAALTAAFAVDGDYNAGVEDAKKVLFATEWTGNISMFCVLVANELEKLKR